MRALCIVSESPILIHLLRILYEGFYLLPLDVPLRLLAPILLCGKSQFPMHKLVYNILNIYNKTYKKHMRKFSKVDNAYFYCLPCSVCEELMKLPLKFDKFI